MDLWSPFPNFHVKTCAQFQRREPNTPWPFVHIFQFLHAMDNHIRYLQEVCRVGGKKFSSCTQSTQYSVEIYKSELMSVHKIDISKDDPEVHPQYICILCERALKRTRTHAKFSGGGCSPVVDWQPHNRINCSFCANHTTKARGRPVRAKPNPTLRGSCDVSSTLALSTSQATSPTCTTSQATVTAPESTNIAPPQASMVGMDIQADQVLAQACGVQRAGIELKAERFIDQHVAEICKLCENVVDNAIEAACCEELFCGNCICTWLSKHNTCPVCDKEMIASQLCRPGRVLCRVLSNRSIRCDFYKPALDGCPMVVPIQHLQNHVKECAFNPDEPAKQQPIRAVRPSSTVAEVTTASPSKLQGNVAGSLIARLVSARAQDGKLEVKMGEERRGHPQIFHLAPSSIVPSTEASASTLKRRASELTRIAENVCGGSDGARVQLTAGLKKLSSAAQEHLLEEAGLRCSTPSPGTALAIKADLRLPWSQLRKLRQWLKVFGVKLESEHTMRQFIAMKLPSYSAMELPMTKRNGNVSMAATVFFPDLITIVMHFVDILHESDRLTWHNGLIPESQIWLKLGGDHGGGNFKLSLQIANTENPNATYNTIPICIFKEKDTPSNLETALGQYRDQIKQLQQSLWRGKAIKLYLFGDYEFQTVNYGLSGSSGVRPCLHCHCMKKDMVLVTESRTVADKRPRTLATLTEDYGKFREAGLQLPQAKNFNNVIRSCILPVPISNVIIPVLHLDLGIFTWMFEAFLKDLNQLDLTLAAKCAATDADSVVFTKLVGLNNDLCVKQLEVNIADAQLNTVNQQLQYVALHVHEQVGVQDVLAVLGALQELHKTAEANFQQLTRQHADLQQQINTIATSKDFTGPCVAAVEPVLQQHHIERQVYHGGAFIGNHAHQALKPAVVTAISHCHINVVDQRCPELSDEAATTARRYKQLLTCYAECRSVFSRCTAVDENEVEQLQNAITNFMANCRVEIVERGLGHITPKLHLLEEHTAPMIKKLGVGLGLLAEQGAESLHSSMNTLDSLFKNIPGDLARLKTVAEQHLPTTTKEASELRPRPRKRKSEEQRPTQL